MNQKSKIRQLIDKLVTESLYLSYEWNDLSRLSNKTLEIAFRDRTNGSLPIIPFGSYWFENDKNIVGLIHSENRFEYCILLFNKKNGLSSLTPIDTNSYYRLKTIIENQIKGQELLIDDFLDS